MRIIFLFIATLLITNAFVYSQKLVFEEAKVQGDIQKVYFQIKGLDEDESDRNLLMTKLLSDPNVYDGSIFTSSSDKTRCQLIIPKDIQPQYIRAILNENGYDFEFSSVSIDGKFYETAENNPINSRFYYPDKSFPKTTLTGNKDVDKEAYLSAKEQWVQSNSKKYNRQKASGTAEFPIIISQEQFESFTAEKKERILAEPNKYQIK